MNEPDLDLALALWRKGAEDERSFRARLQDPLSLDEWLGLQAQQSAEKMLKALLSVAGVAYERTHALERLMDGARLAGTEVPDWLLDLAYELTRYSGMARYEAPLLPAGTLDRQATDAWLRQVREWATAAILDREPRLGQELEKMNALAQADR